MDTLTLPQGWAAPKFQLGQVVYIEATDNEPHTIVGIRYAPYRHIEHPIWYYQLSDPTDNDLTTLFTGTYGHELEQREISARPWPIDGQSCDGVQHPCGKPAAYCNPQWDGSDFETRRSVDLFYCPECWAEVQRIDREAREAA